MAECWKDVTGFPGYQVSDCGRVRTHNKVTRNEMYDRREWKDRILKQKVGKDKCCRVCLWKDGSEHTVLVHRLVANEFCGQNIGTDLTVNHKDGNRLNNNADNLEWMTRADNIRYGFEHGQYTSMIETVLMDEDGVYYNFPSRTKAYKFLGRSAIYLSKHQNGDGIVYSIDGKKYYVM